MQSALRHVSNYGSRGLRSAHTQVCGFSPFRIEALLEPRRGRTSEWRSFCPLRQTNASAASFQTRERLVGIRSVRRLVAVACTAVVAVTGASIIMVVILPAVPTVFVVVVVVVAAAVVAAVHAIATLVIGPFWCASAPLQEPSHLVHDR